MNTRKVVVVFEADLDPDLATVAIFLQDCLAEAKQEVDSMVADSPCLEAYSLLADVTGGIIGVQGVYVSDLHPDDQGFFFVLGEGPTPVAATTSQTQET